MVLSEPGGAPGLNRPPSRLRRHQDTARCLLLAPALLLFLLLGAALFQWAEQAPEQAALRQFRRQFTQLRNNITRSAGGPQAVRQLDQLLELQRWADRRGLLSTRPQWDLAGSLHFCGTVVSTIGYGWTTPQTTTGRLLLLFYGAIGCAGGILFFNLFLERFITLLSFLMHSAHVWRVGRGAGSGDAAAARWRPSVRWVLLYLLICTSLLLTLAAFMCARRQRWHYVKAVYFSFVSFATIGFGDIRLDDTQPGRSQAVDAALGYKRPQHWGYSAASFTVAAFGVCCMYSFFNIVSLLIKQLLNMLLRRVDSTCGCVSSPGEARERAASALPPLVSSSPHRAPLVAEPDTAERYRGAAPDLGDTKESLNGKRVSLAVVHNQFCDSVHQSRSNSAQALSRRASDCDLDSLGSVAIACRKLEADN